VDALVHPNAGRTLRSRERRISSSALVLGCAVVAVSAGLIVGLPAASASTAHRAHKHGGARHPRRRLRHGVVRRSARHATKKSPSGVPPLVFGIYPGGPAGTVGPSGVVAPEDPEKRLAALGQLRAPGRPFVLHLYASYSGPGGASAEQQVGQQVADYGAAGFLTELVLTYRPVDGGSPADVRGFVSFVRSTVRSLGPDGGLVSLQVTNEANVTNAPNASDGYYAGAKDALIQGVIAAKDEARRGGFAQVRVGFNWAYATGPSEQAFWRYLAQQGGAAFVGSLDWVGLDAYPGTWGPSLGSGDPATSTRQFMRSVLTTLRSKYTPLAGIPRTVPLQICESGYPTGPGRTEAMQVTVMRASIDAVDQARAAENVTGYRWFDLRDADSSSSSFEQQYGIMRDDYSPKMGFSAYHRLIASLSVPH